MHSKQPLDGPSNVLLVTMDNLDVRFTPLLVCFMLWLLSTSQHHLFLVMSHGVIAAAGLRFPGSYMCVLLIYKTDASLLYRLGQQLLPTATFPQHHEHHVTLHSLLTQFALLRFTMDAAVEHCMQGSQNLTSKHVHGDDLAGVEN